MPYLIDGHNLIPKIPGLSLQAMDDEQQLIELLQEFCRRRRKQVEVFFDNAPPGGMRVRSFGPVLARFVRQGSSADEAMRKRLTQLGRAARNWSVVSSDRAVQVAARAAQAQVISAEDFARLLSQALDENPARSMGESAAGLDAGPEAGMDANEVDEWMKLFGEDRPEA
jgi:hypothetical protein